MNKRMLRWVYQELPELVDKYVISAEVAERILQYYNRFEEAKLTVQRRIIILFGIIGTGWIGTGYYSFTCA